MGREVGGGATHGSSLRAAQKSFLGRTYASSSKVLFARMGKSRISDGKLLWQMCGF